MFIEALYQCAVYRSIISVCSLLKHYMSVQFIEALYQCAVY